MGALVFFATPRPCRALGITAAAASTAINDISHKTHTRARALFVGGWAARVAAETFSPPGFGDGRETCQGGTPKEASCFSGHGINPSREISGTCCKRLACPSPHTASIQGRYVTTYTRLLRSSRCHQPPLPVYCAQKNWSKKRKVVDQHDARRARAPKGIKSNYTTRSFSQLYLTISLGEVILHKVSGIDKKRSSSHSSYLSL